jgi:hypothetical protein
MGPRRPSSIRENGDARPAFQLQPSIPADRILGIHQFIETILTKNLPDMFQQPGVSFAVLPYDHALKWGA